MVCTMTNKENETEEQETDVVEDLRMAAGVTEG